MKPGGKLAAVLSGLLLSQSGKAQEEASGLGGMVDRLALSGSVRTGYWSSSQNLDDRRNLPVGALWLKTVPRFSDDLTLVAEGWLMNDAAIAGANRQGRLREAYLKASVGDVDLRIGKQLIVWGRADRLNPTDNLTPRDYTLPVAEDDDQRFGAYAAKLDYHLQDWKLTGIWLPKFQANVLPLPNQPGLNLHQRLPDAQQAGVKLERNGGRIDWSLSYFHGLDLNPDISLAGFNNRGVNVQLDHHRYRVFGADAATVVGRYALRAEAAYTLTADENGDDPFIKNPFFYMVAGGDRSFLDSLNINLQYYFRYVSNYRDPSINANPGLRAVSIQQAVVGNQFVRSQHGLTFRIGNQWLNDTLAAEVAGVVGLTRSDFVIKPKLVYAFNDNLKGTLGGNLFGGAETAFFGRLRDNSAVFVDLKFSF